MYFIFLILTVELYFQNIFYESIQLIHLHDDGEINQYITKTKFALFLFRRRRI